MINTFDETPQIGDVRVSTINPNYLMTVGPVRVLLILVLIRHDEYLFQIIKDKQHIDTYRYIYKHVHIK